MMRKLSIPMSLFALFIATAHLNAQSPWPNWRGPNGNGTALDGNYPLRWNESEHIAWKYALPGRGASTPIVLNDQLYLTLAKEGVNVVQCVNTDGKLVWEKSLGKEKAGKNAKASGANSSPITDGKLVFVYFKSGDFAAISPSGQIQWTLNLQEKYGEDTLWWDLGTSPVLTDSAVVIAVMQTGPSYLVALDKLTGKELWKADRWLDVRDESNQSYTTPTLAKLKTGPVLITVGADHATAHSASDGKLLWKVGGFNPSNERFFRSIASPLISGDLVLCPYARGASTTAIQLESEVSQDKRVAWKVDFGSDVPTPALSKGRVYVLGDKGQVTCIHPETGNKVWSIALPKSNKAFSSSPVVANGHVYCTREDGTTFVISESDGQIVSENKLDGYAVATPIFASNRIYLRTYEALYAIQN